MGTERLFTPVQDKMLHGMAAHEGQSVVVLSQVSLWACGPNCDHDNACASMIVGQSLKGPIAVPC